MKWKHITIDEGHRIKNQKSKVSFKVPCPSSCPPSPVSPFHYPSVHALFLLPALVASIMLTIGSYYFYNRPSLRLQSQAYNIHCCFQLFEALNSLKCERRLLLRLPSHPCSRTSTIISLERRILLRRRFIFPPYAFFTHPQFYPSCAEHENPKLPVNPVTKIIAPVRLIIAVLNANKP